MLGRDCYFCELGYVLLCFNSMCLCIIDQMATIEAKLSIT